MSGFVMCPRHGGQPSHGASERLAAKLAARERVPADRVSLVVVVVVESPGGETSWHLVDSENATAAGLDPARSPFALQDGNRESRQMNDRLLIGKPFPNGLTGPRVCKRCLAEAVEPQGTGRLRLPPGRQAS